MNGERQAPLREGLAVAGSGKYGSNLTVPIEVLKVTPIPNGGNLKAYISVRVGPWTIHGIRVVQQPGQRAWVSLPQAEGKPDSSGKRAWWPLIECADKTLKQAIAAAVLKAWGGVEHGRD
jgi:hypothetical protein